MLGSAVALLLALSPAAVGHVPGERMEFAIEHRGIRMGEARIAVGRPEGRVLPVLLDARTTGVADLFKLREQLATYLDLDTGLPRSSSIDSAERSYRRTDTIRYDRFANEATVREKGKNDETHKVAVPPRTVDFLTMVVLLRNLPLDPGARHEFDVLAGRKVTRVAAEVVGREALDTGAGSFQTVKVKVPTSFHGEFREQRPTHVWFSDDTRRVVVRITTEFAVGRIVATLTSYAPGTLAGAR